MSFLTFGRGFLIGFILFKIGHAQGQVYCMKKMGLRVAVLYATKEQLAFNFDQAECHILTKTERSDLLPVKVIYEEQK